MARRAAQQCQAAKLIRRRPPAAGRLSRARLSSEWTHNELVVCASRRVSVCVFAFAFGARARRLLFAVVGRPERTGWRSAGQLRAGADFAPTIWPLCEKLGALKWPAVS